MTGPLCDDCRPHVVAVVRAALDVLADPETAAPTRKIAGVEAIEAVTELMGPTLTETLAARGGA